MPLYGHSYDGDDPDEAYNDTRYISLDMDLLFRLVQLYERDSDIQTFSSAALNHALAGGILFTRSSKMLNDEAKDRHNQVWSGWVKQVLKFRFCLGFCIASFTEREDGELEPTIPSLEHHEIKYYLDPQGDAHFRMWKLLEPSEMSLEAPSSVYGRERVQNIRWWAPDPPTRTGVIRSQILTLIADLEYENHLLRAAFIADRARAQPAMVSQKVDKVYKPMASGQLGSNAPILGGSAATPYLGNGTATHSRTGELVNLMNLTGYSGSQLATALRSRIPSSRGGTGPNTAGLEQIYLEDGRQLVQQLLPEPPHDFARIQAVSCSSRGSCFRSHFTSPHTATERCGCERG